MTHSTAVNCVDKTYRRRMAKRLETNEERNVDEPDGQRIVPNTSESTGVKVGKQDNSQMDASGDASVIQPSDIVKAVIMAADNDMPELNRVKFARTHSDDEDAEACEPIFDESELPPRPVKHTKKKLNDGKSLKQSSSDNEIAKAEHKK